MKSLGVFFLCFSNINEFKLYCIWQKILIEEYSSLVLYFLRLRSRCVHSFSIEREDLMWCRNLNGNVLQNCQWINRLAIRCAEISAEIMKFLDTCYSVFTTSSTELIFFLRSQQCSQHYMKHSIIVTTQKSVQKDFPFLFKIFCRKIKFHTLSKKVFFIRY